MAMKAMKAAKPQNKDDQKANPMKSMKKPLKAKKQPTKTTKLKEADGATDAESQETADETTKLKKALRWVQENESTIIAQMHESWVLLVHESWAKIITQNVPEEFLKFGKEVKDMKYKWYLCIKK